MNIDETQHNQPPGGWILVTGASTGIGRACALWLARRGYGVMAGVRRPADVNDLQSAVSDTENGGALRCIQLDVADSASIAIASQEIEQIVGESGLHALVNNAGIGVHGPVEFVTLDDWRRQFEVNLFGQIAMVQAMLPLLRKYMSHRGKSARIIMMSSIAGRVSQPSLSPYCASKHALEAVSDALRMELRQERLGISLIEPGAIQSEIWRKGLELSAAQPADSPARQRYGRLIDAITRAATKAQAAAIPADRVAAIVERCISANRPPSRVLVGRDAKIAALLRRFLPDRWFDRVLMRAMGI